MHVQSIRFGPFELDTGTGELTRNGTRLRLPPQSARLLAFLAEHRGTLVTRDQIQRHLWGDHVIVDYELGVNHCLNRIRLALRDSARAPRYIETVPRAGYRFIAAVETSMSEPPTVAVLPFANLNGDPTLDYFSDGVTDALITELGSIASLRVISRQSVLHLKGTVATLPEIARELHADAVVEGTLLHQRSKLRITAQLVRIDPERHVWARAYDCDVSDVLGIQRQVARAVADGVQASLTADDVARLSAAKRVDPEVHEAYLKGRHCFATWTAEGLGTALRYLESAIARDPDYAPPHAALADCLSFLGFLGHVLPREALAKAEEAASRAVALDPGNSYAHAVMGWIRLIYNWDLSECEAEIDRALQLDPSNTSARMALSEVLLVMRGEEQRAFAEAREALRLDPLSLYTNTCAAWLYAFAGRHEQALAQARRTLDLYPGSVHPTYVLAFAQLAVGEIEEAVASFERATASSDDALSIGYLGFAYGRKGRQRDAQRLLERLRERAQRQFVPNKSFICIHAGLGDADRAFEWLEKAYAERDPVVFWTEAGPPFERLRADPRCRTFMERVRAAVRH